MTTESEEGNQDEEIDEDKMEDLVNGADELDILLDTFGGENDE